MRVIVQTLGASHKLSILSKNFNQLSSLFDQEQGKSKQLSSIHVYQLSSTFILFYQKQRKVKTTLIQTLVYQLALINSHLCLTRSKESRNNFHTNSCLPTFIFVWPGARKVKTTLIQTLVYQLALVNSHLCLTRSRESQNNSHKLFSDNPRSLIISYPRSIKLQEAWKL